MSRSYKKKIYKDKGFKPFYWRTIRSVTNQKVKQLIHTPELEIPHARSIINDYNYCDYIIDAEYILHPWKGSEKLARK